MARLLRLVLDEARMLHRCAWRWVAAVSLPMVLLLYLQEPLFFRRAGVPLFWSGVNGLLILILGLLPLAWMLRRGQEGSDWSLRSAFRPAATAAAQSAALALYGAGMVVVLITLAYTVDSMNAARGCAGLLGWAPLAHGLFLLPLAALAPAVHHARLGTMGTVVSWIVLVGASLGLLGRGFPLYADTVLPALEPSTPAVRLDQLGITALAAAGGFSVSLAVVRFRLS